MDKTSPFLQKNHYNNTKDTCLTRWQMVGIKKRFSCFTKVTKKTGKSAYLNFWIEA
jgi:hypothetical protein